MPELISPAAMRRALKNGLCPWCGYSLEGLETPRHELTECPECGKGLVQGLVVADPREAGPDTIATTPDRGTPGLARLFSILVLVLIAVVAGIQQLATSTAARAAGQPPLAPGGEVVPAAPLQFDLGAKVMVKLYYATSTPAAQFRDMAVSSVRGAAQSPGEELRGAIVAGEVGDEASAREMLGKLAGSAAPESSFGKDVATVAALYDENPAGPDAQDLERLSTRYGWYGELAATHGLDRTDARRSAVVGGGAALTLVIVAAVLVVAAAFIVGVVLLIGLIVRATSGRLRMRLVPPLPGGSVAIETVAVFVLGFIGLKVLASVVDGVYGPKIAMWVALAAQWLLLLTIFYPVLRGMPRREWMVRLGLYRGEGVLKEIGAGFVAYLASLPVFVAAAAGSMVLVMVQKAVRTAIWPDAKPGLPDNPIVDLLGSSNPWLIVFFFLLASLWAPLVEESIFRGCLYRQLRSGWHWFPAALVTALAFGFMHGYPVLMLGPVISLGFCFAMIREWRGSLIASMTGHCLHNASALLIMLSIFKLAGV
jgi:membrane protease YdiL (CAAX protease family)